MDNHSSHRSEDTINLFKDLGIEILFLPSYSSYLNPVERIWGWIKLKWRAFNMAMPDVHESDRQKEIEQIC
jgi:transposase